MYKPSVNFYEHTSTVIWIVTQEFASLFWKNSLTCISWAQPRGSIQKGWDIIESSRDNRSGRFGNEPTSHFYFGPRKQHKTIMRKVQQRLSLGSQGNPTSISDFIPTGIEQLLSLPAVSDAARLENAEVWVRWSWDCTTENINVNIILGFAILQFKYSTNPFF